jgi:hypothetical protein
VNLHSFGLQGVRPPSYYEAHGAAFHAAQAHFDLRARLLERAPNLSLLLASDPENRGQAIAKMELQAVLEAAMELKGWQA